MKEELRILLLALQQHQHQIVMDYLFLSALGWIYWQKIHSLSLRAFLIGTSAALSLFALGAYVFAIALYLLGPNYPDHIQAGVTAISWLWMHGGDLYPNWVNGPVYGFSYGPVLFLINGIALLLSPSILSSKLPGVLSLAAALGATWVLLEWKTASRLVSLILLSSLVMLLAAFNESSYWNRPEPFLTLLSVLALLLAIRSSPGLAVVGIGLLAGIATALKLYGFIFTIPAAAAALARVENPRRVVLAIVGIACAVTSALPPYLEEGVSIFGFFRFLRLALDEGFPPSQFVENVLFVVILTAPIIAIWIGRKHKLNSSERWLIAALGPSLALITVIGAKSGGGTYYLLPLIPLCIYATAVVYAPPDTEPWNTEALNTETWKIASLIFVPYFLAYGPNLALNIASYRSDAAPERRKVAELKSYLDSYPQAQIGVSDNEHYSSYSYRVFSVWNGHPLDVDFGTWMDLAYVGADEKYILRFVKACTIPVWILPLGEPFSMDNLFFGLGPLLSENFRQTFLANYRQIETGEAYQVWKCKS